MTFTLPLIGAKPNRFQRKGHQSQSKERWLVSGNRAGKTGGCVHDIGMDIFGLHLWRPRFSTRVHEQDVYADFEEYDEEKREPIVVRRLLYRKGDPVYDQDEEFAGRAKRGPMTWWDAAPDYQNVWKPNNYKLFKEMFEAMGLTEGAGDHQYTWRESDRVFIINVAMESQASGEVYRWKAEVVAKSYDAGVSKFMGSGIAGFHTDEEMPRDIYEEGTMRAGKDYSLWFLASLTPVAGMPWIRDEVWDPFEIGTLPEWRSVIRGSLFDNLQNLDHSDIDKILDKFPPGSPERQMRVYGDFISRTGLIYPDFNLDTHVVDDFMPDTPEDAPQWTLYRGIDIGLRNPTACLFACVNEEGEIYIYDEYYVAELPLGDHVKGIRAKTGSRTPVWTVIDPAAEQRDMTTGDTKINFLAERGLLCFPGDNRVAEGISAVTEMLRVHPTLKRPTLFICRRCVNLIRELRSYRWADQGTQQRGRLDPKEKVQKKDDHAVDALRYLVMARPEYLDLALMAQMKDEEFVGSEETGY